MNGKTEKYLKLAADILTLLPIAVCVAAICAAPEQIGGHWNAAGELDRLGSKWELVIWPLMVLFVRDHGSAHRRGARQQRRKPPRHALGDRLRAGALRRYGRLLHLLRRDARGNALDIQPRRLQLTNIVLGAEFIPIGNLMPKLRMNALAGYRTRWSMSNERAWSLAQRHAGRAMVVSGVAMLLIGCWPRG